MEYLVGALVAAALFACMFGAYKLGQRSRRPVNREVDEEQSRQAKKLKKDFQQMMTYDVTKALKGKG